MKVKKMLLLIFAIFFFISNFYIYSSKADSHDTIEYKIKDIPQPKSFLSDANDRKEYFQKLETLLKNKIKKTNKKNNISIGYYNLQTDSKIIINGDKMFVGASTIKVPISMLVADNIKDNKLKLDDKIEYRKKDLESGTGIIQYDNKLVYTIAQLQKYMLENSDNIATNMLIRNFGGREKVYSDISKKYLNKGKITSNQINANYAITYLKYLYDNPANNEHYNTIIKHLKNTEFDNRLYTDFTKNIVAHKIGSNEEYIHDIGLFYDAHPYILVVLTKDVVDAEDFISDVSNLVYKYQTTNYLNQNNYNLLKQTV